MEMIKKVEEAKMKMTHEELRTWLRDGFGDWYNVEHDRWIDGLRVIDLEEIDDRITDAVMTIVIEYAAEKGVFQETRNERTFLTGAEKRRYEWLLEMKEKEA